MPDPPGSSGRQVKAGLWRTARSFAGAATEILLDDFAAPLIFSKIPPCAINGIFDGSEGSEHIDTALLIQPQGFWYNIGRVG